ncbi:MAG TPA: hypothetical protein VFE61_15015 [Candidatus Sulfotelmatobacter sp.]|jgi:hypothetical protein|nr:hypothetical protein [Candidatus Sulfotelmatobacter sp.]
MSKKILIALLLCAVGAAQTKPSPKAKKDPPKASLPVFEIKSSEDTDLPSMPWAKDWPGPSQGFCNGDGNLYVWRYPSGSLAAFTPNGIITFGADKMSDIPTPSTHGKFIAQSGIYIGVDGIENPKQETTTIEDEQGHKLDLRRTTGENHRYIARFDEDGSYQGSLKLDLPFYVYTFAAFESGNFVAQGLDDNKIPRVALLDSGAQLIRYLELPKDMSAVAEIPAKNLKMDDGIIASDVAVIAMSSSFEAANGKILFLRSMAGKRVYEIQESGQVRMVTIKPPEGYGVEGLVATDRNWLVRFRKPKPGGAWSDAEHSLFEVDPQSGKLLTEYRVKPPDTGVSCFFDGKFWAVRRGDGKLIVVRGSAEPYRGEVKPPAVQP